MRALPLQFLDVLLRHGRAGPHLLQLRRAQEAEKRRRPAGGRAVRVDILHPDDLE